jgi:hypothetical protein
MQIIHSKTIGIGIKIRVVVEVLAKEDHFMIKRMRKHKKDMK